MSKELTDSAMPGERLSAVRAVFDRYPKLGKALKNSGWIIVCGFGNSVVNLLAGIFVARYLGPTELGAVNYSMAIVAILAAVVNLGLDGVALREISRAPRNAAAYIAACSVLRGIASIVVFAGLSMSALFMPPSALEGREWYLVVLAFAIFAPPLQSAAIFFNSHLRSSIPKLSLLASSLLYVIIVAAGVFWRLSPTYFVVAMAFRQVLGAAFTYGIYLRQRERLTGEHTSTLPDGEDGDGAESKSIVDAAKTLLHDGWPQTLSGVALLIQAYCDQVMLGEMKDLDSVAQYGISLKVVIVITAVPVAVVTSFSPSLAKRYVANRDSFWTGFHQVSRLTAIACISMIAFTLCFGTPLVTWAYGAEYALAGSLLSLMIFRSALASFGALRSVYLVNANILRYSLVTVIIGSVLNVILNFFMIPPLGVWGAIYASFASFIVTTIFLDLCFAKTRPAILVMFSAWVLPMFNYERKAFRL